MWPARWSRATRGARRGRVQCCCHSEDVAVGPSPLLAVSFTTHFEKVIGDHPCKQLPVAPAFRRRLISLNRQHTRITFAEPCITAKSRSGPQAVTENTAHVTLLSSSECFSPAVTETLEDLFHKVRLHALTCDHSQICQTEIVHFGPYRCVLESPPDITTHTPSREGRGRILSGGSSTCSASSIATTTGPDLQEIKRRVRNHV